MQQLDVDSSGQGDSAAIFGDRPRLRGTALPSQCVTDSTNYVYDIEWLAFIVIIVIAVVYLGAAIYFYTQRENVSFLTRSPITVALSLFLLGIDSILNTLIYSGTHLGNAFHWQCNLGIVATVVG